MRNNSPHHQQRLSERKAAEWLGMSQRTLWQRRHDGLIPFIRDGRMIRYDLDDLRTYTDASRVQNEVADHA